MDTRFWGPDGWKLLHSICVNYNERYKEDYILFFDNLKYVLPCIYCRNSFTEYSEKLKIDSYLKDNYSLSEWLYKIHNMVNDKLRGQKLLDEDDPPFEEVYQRYITYVDEINKANCIGMPGWDFIYCILFNYPKNKDLKEESSERLAGYYIFLTQLPKILPFKKAKDVLMKLTNSTKLLNSRKELQNLAYKMEKKVNNYINCECISFKDRCSIIESHRAGCKKLTCRVGTVHN
jgi:hypothetical protein